MGYWLLILAALIALHPPLALYALGTIIGLLICFVIWAAAVSLFRDVLPGR